MKKVKSPRLTLAVYKDHLLQSGKLTQKELDEARSEVQREVARELLAKA